MNLCIIQARLASTRFPNKVLAGILGRSMLAHVVERAQAIPGIDHVVLSIPARGKEEEALCHLGAEWGVVVYRDQLPLTETTNDVLGGFAATARALKADAIVRVTADCPLLDPELGGRVLRWVSDGSFRFASNAQPRRSYPDGLDVEAFTRDLLEEAARSEDPDDRQHVTPSMWRRCESMNLTYPMDLSAVRWTVDRPEDLDTIRAIARHLPDGAYRMEDTIKAAKAAGVWP